MFRRFLLVLLVALLQINPVYSEEIPQRIDGRVISVDEQSRQLVLDFENPATEERSQMEFIVAPEAGFKDFKKLSQLKSGDLISLDYVQENSKLKAIYVIHIPLEKVYFTHKEIAGAFTKIKSGRSDPNIHEKS